MLNDHIPKILNEINKYGPLFAHNHELLDIFEGNLLPYVDLVLKQSLNENYYKTIKSKIAPINVLTRTIDKIAKVYSSDVVRTSTTDQPLVDWYTRELKLNSKMSKADEYATMFCGYAVEPCVLNGVPKLRVIPYDRFVPISLNEYDPTYMDVFVKFVGKKEIVSDQGTVLRDVFYAYSNEEFTAFDSTGEIYKEALVGNDGVNPYGVIPFVYGNRSDNKIIPTIKTDMLQISKLIPAIMTDLIGCIQFQSFSIVYGVDIDMENCKIGPNAIWSLKSDLASQKAPQLGTISPTANIAEVLNFIQSMFSMWLESMSIKTGNIGQVDGSNFASGISKIIDEMDTIDARKRNIEYFINEERELWNKIRVMHNHWVLTGQLTNLPLFSDAFDIQIEFTPPTPYQSRAQMIAEVKEEMALGLMNKRMAIRKLYPTKKDYEINEMIVELSMEEENGEVENEVDVSKEQGGSKTEGESETGLP